ncbi:MAG: hypothetical protein ACOH1I_09180 [Gallionellaceae bacterium]|jgi:hypothetical protein
MKKIVLLCLSLMLIATDSVYAQLPAKANKIIIGVVWVPALNTEVYAVDEKRFNNLDLLKIFLQKQLAGSVVVWDPGCVRIGDKPLLSSATEMKEFKRFVEKMRMKFVEYPSG